MFETVTLADELIELEPLAADHGPALEAAAADGELADLWYTSVPGPGRAASYIADACRGRDAGSFLPFAVRDPRSGTVVGSTRFYDPAPEVPRVAIGYTWYAQTAQRTHVNAATKRLLLAYAFEDLDCAVVEFHTDFYNQQSRQALARLGARQDGILRSHQRRPDGTLRDTVCFSILRAEWPDVRRSLDHRIDRALRRSAAER